MLRHICNLKPGHYFFKAPPSFVFCPLPFPRLCLIWQVGPVWVPLHQFGFWKDGNGHILITQPVGGRVETVLQSASFHLVNQLTKNIPWKTTSVFSTLLPRLTHTPSPHVVLGSPGSSSPLDSLCCTSGRPHCPHPDLYLIHAGLMIHGAAYFVLNFVPNKFEI